MNLRSLRPRDDDSDVIRDADALTLGDPETALDTAAAYSWREDTGLLVTRSPGHWHRVGLEISRRNDAILGPSVSSIDEESESPGGYAVAITNLSRPGLSRFSMVMLSCFLIAPLAAAPFNFRLAYHNGQFNFRPLTIRKNIRVINAAELADQNCAYVLRRTSRPNGVLHTTKKLVCND